MILLRYFFLPFFHVVTCHMNWPSLSVKELFNKKIAVILVIHAHLSLFATLEDGRFRPKHVVLKTL
jgi:hypothetical protein